jgi:hypothetical protein
MTRNVIVIIAAGLLLLTQPMNTFAQVNASVGGTVSDSTGALIPGVEVTAVNVNTGISATRLTNEAGAYNFASLQPGTYRVTVSLPGFQTVIRENVQLSQGQDVRFNFTLQVGTVAQSVEVLADSASMLATTSASVGNVLTVDSVRSLPLVSRNVLDLARGLPGAINEPGTGGGQSFGGMRQSQINTTRDGLPTGDGRYLDWNGVYSATFTSPDLVEEVQVNVTTADAAMGRGSAQIRMQTRSGTNEFHGALFYTNNNSALHSNTWFTNLVGGEKDYKNRNQFGGRLGGPILKNKAFFFFLFDGQRYVEKSEVITQVLTAPARQGIFRFLTQNAPGTQGGVSRRNGNAFALPTFRSVDLAGNTLTADPASGAPLFMNSFNLFSDVRDPNRTRIDPVWVGPQYLARMPLPNDWTVGDGLNTAGIRWQRTHAGLDGATGATQTANRNHYTTRFDYQINTNNKIFFSMTRESNWGVTGQTGLPDYPDGFFGEVARKPDFYTSTWTSTLSPTVLNEFRWGLKRDSWFGEPPADVGCCRDARNYNTDNLTETAKEVQKLFPTVDNHVFHIAPGGVMNTNWNFGQFAWMGVPTPRGSISPLMQFADTLSWTQGKHSFQSGFEFTHTGSDGFNHGGDAWTRPNVVLGIGTVPVPNITTANFPGLSSFEISTGENILARLAGSIGTLNQRYFINSPDKTEFSDYREGVLFWRDYRQNDWSGFFKDTWKATQNLTLTMGVRYDKYGSPYDRTGLGVHPKGGQAGLFGISGTNHSALFNPRATGGSLTVFEFAGKHSPNSSELIIPNDWNNFAPSLGFSWNVPWFTKATVLRGGYGLTYTAAPTLLQYSGNIGSAPGAALDLQLPPTGYVDIQSIVSNSRNYFPLNTGGARPFSAVPLTNRTTSITGYADDRVAPYVQSFNLSLQRELARNMTMEIGYIGTKGTKLWSSEQLNTVNIFENGILDAFNITRAGGNAPLFDQMLLGRNFTGIGVVNGTTLTGSEALRRFTATNAWIANGEVAQLANYINSTPALGGGNGGILRQAGLPENFIVVNPQFGGVTLAGNNDNSIYHALQTQVTQRLSHGFSGQFSYVWSRNIGNTAAGTANASDTTANTRDPRNRSLQRGIVELHRTHNFKSYGSWQLPFGPNRALLAGAPNFVHRIVEGWEVSGVFNWTSGPPLDFTTTRRTLHCTPGCAAAGNTNTPDLVGELPQGKVTVRDGFVEYFPGLTAQRAPLPNFGGHATVTGQFTNQVVRDSSGNIIMQNPEPGKTGNMSLNIAQVEGPSRLGLDMALSKRVRINEGMSFTLRVDALNILNTPQWGNPVTDINQATFGRITTVRQDTNRSFTINTRIDF